LCENSVFYCFLDFYFVKREYVCIPVAQMFHWYEIKLKMMTMDLGTSGKKITKVPKLNEAKAIEQVYKNTL